MTKHYHHPPSHHHDKPAFYGRSRDQGHRESRRPNRYERGDERGSGRREQQSYHRSVGQSTRHGQQGGNRGRETYAQKPRRFENNQRHIAREQERRTIDRQKNQKVHRGKRTPPGIRWKVITKGKRGVDPMRLKSRKAFLTKNKSLVLVSPKKRHAKVGRGSALLTKRAKNQIKGNKQA